MHESERRQNGDQVIATPWYVSFFAEEYFDIYGTLLSEERATREVEGIVKLHDRVFFVRLHRGGRCEVEHRLAGEARLHVPEDAIARGCARRCAAWRTKRRGARRTRSPTRQSSAALVQRKRASSSLTRSCMYARQRRAMPP